MPLNVKLVVVGGDVKTTEIKLRLPSTIGRGRGTTIVLPHPLVSRQHCELFESGGQLMVRDLGSLNGTFVNNQRITEAPLSAGELLTVGTVTFRAVYESDESAAGKPALTVKGAGDKTLQAAKAARAAAPKPAPAKPAEEESGPLEFNFEEPLLPADEEGHPTEAARAADATERLDATVASRATPAGKPKPAQGGGKSPGKGKSAAAPASSPKGDDAADEEEGKVDSSTDDDLNDFLDSLGSK